jgi:hypothetical protein
MVMIFWHFRTLLSTFPTQTTSALLPCYQQIPKIQLLLLCYSYLSIFVVSVSLILFLVKLTATTATTTIICVCNEKALCVSINKLCNVYSTQISAQIVTVQNREVRTRTPKSHGYDILRHFQLFITVISLLTHLRGKNRGYLM